MIYLGSIQDLVLNEYASGDWKARVLKPDDDGRVEVEFENDGNVMFRKKFPSLKDAKDTARQFLKKKKDKSKQFNLKNARLYSGDPTMNYGPSTAPFASENLHDYAPGGGLLRHMMPPKTKKKRHPHHRAVDLLDEPSGNSDSAYNRSKYLFLEHRDDEDGLSAPDDIEHPNDSRDRRHNKPPKPIGEFSPDIQDKPEEFNPNYTSEYGRVETDQDWRAKHLDDVRKKEIHDRDKSGEEWKLIYINKSGNEASISLSDFQMAVRLNSSPKYRRSRIVRVK